MISKIALVKEHKNELKTEYKVDEARVPVKVIGIGDKALKVRVFESSTFTKNPVWKQYWINFENDVKGGNKRAVMLIEEMVKTISQTTL